MIQVFGYSYIYFTGTVFIILFMSLNLRLYIDKKIIILLNMVSLIYTDYFKYIIFMIFVTSYLKKYRNDGSQLLKWCIEQYWKIVWSFKNGSKCIWINVSFRNTFCI